MSQRHLIWAVFVATVLLSGCKEEQTKHSVLRYFPSEFFFKEGYVNKYYEYYYPVNSNSSAGTQITYSLYQKTSDSTYFVETYNSGFWLTRKGYYHFDDNAIYLDSSLAINRLDTFPRQVEKPLRSVWEQKEMPDFHYQVNGNFNGGSFSFLGRQIGLKDSLIEGRAAKIFVNEYDQYVYQEDTTERTWTEETYYVEDLGIYGSKDFFDNYTWEVELVEQMPLSKFRKLADHESKRVAYIDPAETLDQGSDFVICGHELFIADYYNSTPDGDYKYGKAALLDTVFSNLDEEKLRNQSGMLTFRFVVNCKGEAGRFIAEGFDQNYQPYQFAEETVEHMYEIMKKLEEWQIVVIREEPRDAYFYFTFKLDDGKITDVLP